MTNFRYVVTIDTPANVGLPLRSMLEFQTLSNDAHSITCTASVAYLTRFKISPTLSLLVLYFFWQSFWSKKLLRKNFYFCKKFFLLDRPSPKKIHLYYKNVFVVKKYLRSLKMLSFTNKFCSLAEKIR